MKAWYVYAKDRDGVVIAFGDTTGKARSNALLCRDVFCNVSFMQTVAKRCKEADQYYKEGKHHLDWNNLEDRIILANKFGFVCSDADIDECVWCGARECCRWYQDNKEELL